MFYSILAELFLIKLFKKSIYQAPMLRDCLRTKGCTAAVQAAEYLLIKKEKSLALVEVAEICRSSWEAGLKVCRLTTAEIVLFITWFKNCHFGITKAKRLIG